MRCPKCHYLSFEPEPRCKNCGYGFSLAESHLLIREPETVEDPLADLAFRDAGGPTAEPGHLDSGMPAMATELSVPVEPVVVRPADSPRLRQAPAPTTELPLFVKALSLVESDDQRPHDTPLVAISSDARPPLSVRRKVGDGTTPKPRPAPGASPRRLGPLDRDLLEDLQRIETLERRETTAEARAADRALPGDRAGAGNRLAAAALDAALMGGLAVSVLWVTLRWCDLPLDAAAVLPALPTMAFLLLVGVGYLLMFTALGGQTIGKMAFGLRVVDDTRSPDADGTLTVRQAIYRELLTLPSVLAFGVGFVPALMGDERALHDRLTHTRVVRA